MVYDMNSKTQWKGFIEVGLGIFSALIVILLFRLTPSKIFNQFEEQTLDWRYQKKIQKKISERKEGTIDDIIIVEIDDRSLEKLGRFEQWPRSYHARLIHFIESGHPAAIGFDILFMEKDQTDSRSDDSLTTAIRQAKNVFLAMSFSRANPDNFIHPMHTEPEGFDYSRFALQLSDSGKMQFPEVDRFDGKFFELYNVAQGIGFANFFPKENTENSVIRDMPLLINFNQHQYPSMALAMMMGVTGMKPENLVIGPNGQLQLQIPQPDSQWAKLELPTDKEGHLLIDYQGGHRTFRYVSYYDVLKERAPHSLFRGKIVLVGATAAGLYDWRPVPFQATFPGVEIHANLIYTLLNQSFIRKIGPVGSSISLICLAILVILPAVRLRFFYSLLLVLSITVVYGFLALLLFVRGNLWIELFAPIMTIFISYFSVVSHRYLTVEKDKKIIKKQFAHYLSPEVVNELQKNRDELALGGKRMVATTFFSDIKNFTTVAEKMEPEELVALLNEYHSAMTEIVLKYGGYLDKFIGDAIMAVFGVPLPLENHTQKSCQAALEMQDRLQKLRVKWELEKRPQLEARIGIHVGALVVGNIGGEKRFDYTVIGDCVNLASRLEGANKIYRTSILISEDIYEAVKDEVIVRELDFIRVKGKKQPVRVYELIAEKGYEMDETGLKVLAAFAKGLAIYRHGDWEHAYNEFQKALRLKPEDGPSQEFFDRCKRFIDEKRHVTPDWDGVYEAQTK
jgi:adenylate cyclase